MRIVISAVTITQFVTCRGRPMHAYRESSKNNLPISTNLYLQSDIALSLHNVIIKKKGNGVVIFKYLDNQLLQ